MEILDTDIVFVTTSLSTKWEAYSAGQVKKYFPGSTHIHVDGRTGWFDVWFEWIKRLENRPEKYFIHLDEDCFILNRENVLEAIELMVNEGSVVAGIQDSNFYWRDYSSVCINPFFMIGKVREVVDACRRNYRHLVFSPKYVQKRSGSGSKGKLHGVFKATEFEPYYCFFYNLYECGHHFTFLQTHDDYRFANSKGELPATTLRLNESVKENTGDICVHMWYTRVWNNAENIERYTKLEAFLNA